MRRVLWLAAVAALVPSPAAEARVVAPDGFTVARSGLDVGIYEQYLAPPTQCPGADLPTGSIATQTAAMLCLIDYARAQHGDPALTRQPLLARSAQIKLDDIVHCHDFSHTACGHTVEYPFEQAGYINNDYAWSVGENLAHGTNLLGSPRSIMLSWLNSDPHRENLFDDTWREQNVAVIVPTSAIGFPDDAIWVSHFGVRKLVEDALGSTQVSAGAATARPRLRVTVRPRSAMAGHRTRFSFRVRVGSRGIAGAIISFASRHVRTGSTGRAAVSVRLSHATTYHARVTRSGYRRGVAAVRAHHAR